MTSPESPSNLLRRAASRLEAKAGSASEGPWTSAAHPHCPDESNVLDSRGVPLFTSSCCGGNCYGYVERSEDAAWIATLNPSVATPLVVMLRYHAYVIGWAKSLDEVSRNSGAIDLALQILGETP